MSQFYGIDMQKIAVDQYGPGTQALCTGDHAYHWCAKTLDGQKKSLDLQGYADRHYGGNWRAVLIGMGKGDWKWHDPFKDNWLIQPVLMVAKGLGWDIDAIEQGKAKLRINAEYAQTWYREKLGKTFALSPHTLVAICPDDADKLLNLARSTQQKELRFDMLDYHKRVLRQCLGNRINSNIIYACASFTGYHPNEDYGSAAEGNIFALSSDNTSLTIDRNNWTNATRRAAYDFIHEAGHSMGLSHPTEIDDGKDWRKTIMYQGVPEWAILLQRELKFLLSHPMMKEA